MPDQLCLKGLRILAGENILVDNVGLTLAAGEIVALVGASGSGKTLTARSMLGLPGPKPGVVQADLEIRIAERVLRPYEGMEHALLDGQLARFSSVVERRFQMIRGSVVGYLPQDARGALNPLWTVRRLVEEGIRLRGGKEPAEHWLVRAGYPDPHEVLTLYPHQLSGGMAQRVCIAMTLARGSRFIIADEPTTGLDPTVQEEVLAEVSRVASDGVGVLFITHDLRLVPRLASRVVFLHAGKVVEEVEANRLPEVRSPQARALVEATSRVGGGLL